MGVWPQTRERWESEGLSKTAYHWNWFTGEEKLGMDPREFIYFNSNMIPSLPEYTIAEDERTITFRDSQGRTRLALKEGTVNGGRMSMDTYISFPVSCMEDWLALKPRWDMAPERYEPFWHIFRVESWRRRTYPLIFAGTPAQSAFTGSPATCSVPKPSLTLSSTSRP